METQTILEAIKIIFAGAGVFFLYKEVLISHKVEMVKLNIEKEEPRIKKLKSKAELDALKKTNLQEYMIQVSLYANDTEEYARTMYGNLSDEQIQTILKNTPAFEQIPTDVMEATGWNKKLLEIASEPALKLRRKNLKIGFTLTIMSILLDLILSIYHF